MCDVNIPGLDDVINIVTDIVDIIIDRIIPVILTKINR